MEDEASSVDAASGKGMSAEAAASSVNMLVQKETLGQAGCKEEEVTVRGGLPWPGGMGGSGQGQGLCAATRVHSLKRQVADSADRACG